MNVPLQLEESVVSLLRHHAQHVLANVGNDCSHSNELAKLVLECIPDSTPQAWTPEEVLIREG